MTNENELEAELDPDDDTDQQQRAEPSKFAEVFRGGARGMVGAMAMTGMRQATTGLGWLEKVPPEEILEKHAPGLLRSLSEGKEDVAIELLHWTYGAGAGAAFGLLPDRVRRSRLAGPVYGTLTWLGFELAIGPALGIASAERRSVASRVMLALDHLLYGVVVAGQLAPEPARRE